MSTFCWLVQVFHHSFFSIFCFIFLKSSYDNSSFLSISIAASRSFDWDLGCKIQSWYVRFSKSYIILACIWLKGFIGSPLFRLWNVALWRFIHYKCRIALIWWIEVRTIYCKYSVALHIQGDFNSCSRIELAITDKVIMRFCKILYMRCHIINYRIKLS